MALIVFMATLVVKIVTERVWHHIVAKADYRAIIGRLVLRAAKIDINSIFNFAHMREATHWRVHKTDYHVLVSSAVTLGYFIGGRNGVLAVLAAFKKILET